MAALAGINIINVEQIAKEHLFNKGFFSWIYSWWKKKHDYQISWNVCLTCLIWEWTYTYFLPLNPIFLNEKVKLNILKLCIIRHQYKWKHQLSDSLLLGTEIRVSQLLGKWSNYKATSLSPILIIVKQEFYLLSSYSSYVSTARLRISKWKFLSEKMGSSINPQLFIIHNNFNYF